MRNEDDVGGRARVTWYEQRVLNGEDLSRYSNKIESVSLRRCPYYRYLIEKVTPTDIRITNISQSLPHKMAENSWYE